MPNLSKNLTNFVNNYANECQKQFKGSTFGSFVRNDLKKTFEHLLTSEFILKGSVGQSTWTFVPWFGIFHPLVTSSAQNGFYVVYLVNQKAKTISLSLNQGVKEITDEFGKGRRGLDRLNSQASLMRARIKDIPTKLSETSIILDDLKGPGKFYEAGHTLGRTYKLVELENSEQLESDLAEIIKTYKVLVSSNGYESLTLDLEKDCDLTVDEKKKLALHKRFDGRGNTNKVKRVKGYICEACLFDFQKTYGELGKDYIEAHHLIPFEDLKVDDVRRLDIMNDFAVLCANCHRMIHRQNDPSDISALRETLQKAKNFTS